jgi:N utilization substance protein B
MIMCSVNDVPSSEKINSSKLSRRDMRALIFHLLYALEAYEYEISVAAIIDTFNRGYDLDIARDSEVFTITSQIVEKRKELDVLIVPLLHNWRFERISVCTKLILRLALWEMTYTPTAPNIIINEAIELAKCFAEDDAYKFINGLLDEYVKNTGKATTVE